MDSLAYSVMLELKTNTADFNKNLSKSLDLTKDYHKKVEGYYKSSAKEVNNYIDAHKGLNSTLYTTGEIFRASFILPLKIIKDVIVKTIKAITSFITGLISHIDGYIEDSIQKFYGLMEEYRFAHIQAVGGVTELNNRMIDLMMTTGATYDVAKKISFGLADVGFNAKTAGKEFNILTQTVWEFERITGVSSDTSAKFSKSLYGLGFNAEKTRKIFIGLAKQAYISNLNASELTSVMENLRQEMYQLEFAFDIESVERYAESLVELSGAAKMAGVDVSKASQLMSELNNNAMKFVVSLGSDAFYKDASSNMESLIKNVDNIKSSLENVPPGLKPQLLREIYGIDAATLKMLDSMAEFRKRYPALKSWGDMLNEANSSLKTMYEIIYNKIMGVFNSLAQRFALVRIEFVKAFTKDIPEKIQKLIKSIGTLINKIFDKKTLDDWGKTASGWVSKINKKFGDLIDSADKWVKILTKSDALKIIKKTVNDLWIVFKDRLIPAVFDFASAIKDQIYGAVLFVWDIFMTVFNAIDKWIDTGGPQKLIDKIKNFGEFVGKVFTWIIDNPIKSLGIAIAVTLLPALGPTGLIVTGLIAAGVAVAKIVADFVNLANGVSNVKKEVEKLRNSDKTYRDEANHASKRESELAAMNKKDAVAAAQEDIKRIKNNIKIAKNAQKALSKHVDLQAIPLSVNDENVRFSKDELYIRDHIRKAAEREKSQSVQLEMAKQRLIDQEARKNNDMGIDKNVKNNKIASPLEIMKKSLTDLKDIFKESRKDLVKLYDEAKKGNKLGDDRNKKLEDLTKKEAKNPGRTFNMFDRLFAKIGGIQHMDHKTGEYDRWTREELTQYAAKQLQESASNQFKTLSNEEAMKQARQGMEEALSRKVKDVMDAHVKDISNIIDTKPQIPNTINRGEASGLKAEHVSVSRPDTKINTNDKQTPKEMVQDINKMVAILGSIDNKIDNDPKGKYPRNNYPRSETAVITWGA